MKTSARIFISLLLAATLMTSGCAAVISAASTPISCPIRIATEAYNQPDQEPFNYLLAFLMMPLNIPYRFFSGLTDDVGWYDNYRKTLKDRALCDKV